MLPLLSGAAKSEGADQIASRPHILDSASEPNPSIRPEQRANSKPQTVTVTVALPEHRVRYNPQTSANPSCSLEERLTTMLYKDRSKVLISKPGTNRTLLSDNGQRQRARALPGSARSRRVPVELLIRHFESLDQDDEDPRFGRRRRAVTAPAPYLRGRYHSALCQGRRPGERHSSAVILEDRVAEESPSSPKQDTRISRPLSSPQSPQMWPFTDREGNPKIEPLVATEDTSSADHQDVRRKSTPEVEQQEGLKASLRPSKSLTSLKLVPERRGLCIPPRSAVSQSSEVCAQGEVTSPPRKTETHEQPVSDQTAQEHEQACKSKREPASTNDIEESPASREDALTTVSVADSKPMSMDKDQEPKPVANAAEGEVKQASAPIKKRSQSSEAMPVLDRKEPRDPMSTPAADNPQSSATKTIQNGDNGALLNDLPSPESVQSNWLRPWPRNNTDAVESPVLRHPLRNSSTTAPIPTIHVHQTTEPEETELPSRDSAAKCSETKPNAPREPISEAPTDHSYISTQTLTGDPAQLDAVLHNPAACVVRSTAIEPELPEIEAPSAIGLSLDKVKGSVEPDRLEFAKLAVRKARNLAGHKFVLSILLGRRLAEQTKPQLEELARPSMRRPGKTVPVPGPSQVDGIAELEGELGVPRDG